MHAVVVAANGEIYNYKELYEEMGGEAFYKPKTGSDCEVGVDTHIHGLIDVDFIVARTLHPHPTTGP